MWNAVHEITFIPSTKKNNVTLGFVVILQSNCSSNEDTYDQIHRGKKSPHDFHSNFSKQLLMKLQLTQNKGTFVDF